MRLPFLLVGALALLPFLGPGASAEPSPKSSDLVRCYQACFDRYLENQQNCRRTWCDQILVFTWCQDEELADCLKAAGHLFEACLAHCDHQAKRGNGPRPRNR